LRLKDLDKFIPAEGVFFDVGANIGNHSIYWAKRGGRTIYAFEPIQSIFSILSRNVELNSLQQVVRCKNVVIGAGCGRAEVVFFEKGNIGGTQIAASADGNLIIDSIDNLVAETGEAYPVVPGWSKCGILG
jgi:FkbM family methyltransferase